MTSLLRYFVCGPTLQQIGMVVSSQLCRCLAGEGMDYSVHIHTPDIAGGRRSSHITTFHEDSHKDKKKSSTPKTQGQQTTEPSTSGEPSTTAAKPPSTSHNESKVLEVITVVVDPGNKICKWRLSTLKSLVFERTSKKWTSYQTM